MGIGFIISGMVFLFNPFINVIDVLPDFIGYLLILHGMSKMADIEAKMAEAKRRMTHALALSLCRFAVMMLSFFAKFDSTLTLVFVFSFAVLEVFFVLPAFRSFFDGLEYSQMRFSEQVVFRKTEDAAKMTPIFIVVRSACAVLPELTSLVTDYGYVTSGGGGLADNSVLRVMLTMICAAAALVFGAVWLSMICKALSEVRKSKSFISFLEEKYALEVLPNESLFMKRSVKGFWRIWFAAFFCLFCISIDYCYIIPEFAFGLFAFFAFRKGGKYVEERNKTCALCLAFTGVMIAEYVFLIRYCVDMGYELFPYESEDFIKYYLPYVLPAFAGYVLLVLICKRATAAMKRMTADAVGLRESADARRRELDEDRRAYICKKIDRLFALECASAAVGAVFMAVMPWFGLAWAVRSVFNVIVVICIYSIMCDVSAEAEKVL